MIKYYFSVCFMFIFFFSTSAQSLDEPEKTRFYYDGMLNKSSHVQLNLHIENHEIVGGFVIETTGNHYHVQGRLSKDKSGIGLWVYNGKEYIAAIEAKVVSDERGFGKQLLGIYKPENKKAQEIIFKKIAEYAIKNNVFSDMSIKII